MTTVACVLRSGGVYGPQWVARLQRAADKHLKPDRFVCLSDVDVPCERIPLIHDYPGWWAKLELFRPGLFDGLVFFVDLDTLIVGDCPEVWEYEGRFAALTDFTRPELAASGLLLWRANEVPIYEAAQKPQDHPNFLRAGRRMDPWWNRVERDADRMQKMWPGMIGSFKVDKLEHSPKDRRIVCFHGQPKPEDVRGWVAKAWAA